MNDLVVGVDVGGSKTRLQGSIGSELVADLTVPSGRVLHDSYAKTATALAALVQESVGGLSPVSALVVGARGCDTTAQCRRLHAELAVRLDVPTLVVNDAELVMPAAGLARGVAVIAGTGSIAVGYDDHGDLLVAGGWGWILGDEGGAAGLVREAAREALARTDRGEAPDELTRRLEDAFEVPDLSYLSGAMARSGGASRWGEHAHHVFLAADSGAESAASVIRRAGSHLAALVVTLRGRGAEVQDVVVAGGVITAQPRLEEAVRAALSDALPDSRLHVLHEPPVVGATRLAVDLLSDPHTRLLTV
ncbi:BadF/BadG/BcrA/BcrD ATPase family protein [Isoptericola cucumis]|uniref:N-acetylglucosamine kinase n=1 Tax=Isoptericola cucumis TaxID=1776856 RepID=UPI00320A91D8